MALIKKTVFAGEEFTLTSDHPVKWEAPNRDVVKNSKTFTNKYDSPGVRLIRVTSGDDVELNVIARPVPAPPVVTEPPIVVGPTPPEGQRVTNPDELKRATAAGGNILLPRDLTIKTGKVNVPKSGTKFYATGDPSRPMPIIQAPVVIGEGVKDVSFDGIDLFGNGIDENGLFGFKTGENISFANGRIRSYGGFGLFINGGRNVNVANTLIADNAGPDKASGLHFIDVYGWSLKGVVFDTNGWRQGKWPSTVYDHGAYIRANNSPGDVEDCIFYNNASHGGQFRSGGNIRRSLFWNNPIGMSYGYVNGNPVFNGGVSGEVTQNVFWGTRDIAGSPRGYIEFGNIKAARVFDNIVDPALKIYVRRCDKVEGAFKDVGVMSLAFEKLYWPGGTINVGNGLHISESQVGISTPKQADLRQVLGSDFMAAKARVNPAGAAKWAVGACRAAVGLS